MRIIPLFVLLLLTIMCFENVSAQNIELFQTEGSYNSTSTIYTDAQLHQTTKASASYYLEKKFVGADTMFHAPEAQQYFEKSQKLNNLSIDRYIYKFKSIKNNQIKVAVMVAQVKGKDIFLFDGMGFTTDKTGKPNKKFYFTTWLLNGEVTDYIDGKKSKTYTYVRWTLQPNTKNNVDLKSTQGFAKVTSPNIELLQSEGLYNSASTIYTDAQLRQSTKDKAIYYLKKDMIGQDLVLNDSDTGDYWKDLKYFKDTPIVRYIYNYKSLTNNQTKISTTAAEIKGQSNYLFDGMAFTTDSNEVPNKKFFFVRGVLDGDVTEYKNGKEINKYGYSNGKIYTNKQNKDSIYTPMIGFWEAELENNGNFSLHTLVNDFKEDGSMETYKNIYYSKDMFADPVEWEITDYSEGLELEASWVYSPKTENTGVLKTYLKWELYEIDDIRFLNQDKISMKATYCIKPEEIGKEYIFIRKK